MLLIGYLVIFVLTVFVIGILFGAELLYPGSALGNNSWEFAFN